MINDNLFTLDLNNQKLPEIKDYFGAKPDIEKKIEKENKKEVESEIENFEDFKKRIFENFEPFFKNYLKLFFFVTEGKKLKENWHLDLIGFNAKKILMQKSFRDIWNLCPTSGKCLGKGTLIRMFDGSLKKVEDIKVGEFVMGDDSTKRKVLNINQGLEEMFKVSLKDGSNFICNGSHILVLKNTNLKRSELGKNGVKKHYTSDEKLISVFDYIKSNKTIKKRWKMIKSGVEYKEQNLEIDPYLLGLWLGDGTSSKSDITTIDKEIEEYLYSWAKKTNHKINIYHQKNTKAIAISFSKGALRDKNGHFTGEATCLRLLLKKYNLLNNKHIPQNYLINSRENRLKLLAGLLDTDGYSGGNNKISFTFKEESLIDETVELARSLGFYASKFKKFNKKYNKDYYCCYITGNISEIPCLLKRKKKTGISRLINPLLQSFKIESLGIGDYYGFELDCNHKFLLSNFTVSHNSSIGIAFATLYIGFYPSTRATIFSGTQMVRDKYARCIRMMLENSKRLTKEENGVDFPSYQELFPNVRISDERNRQEEFYIKDYAGYFRILSIDSKTTGIDSDFTIVDDPIDYRTMKEQGFKYIETVNNTILYLMTRLREIDGKKPFLVIMQRMCEGDTTDCLVETQFTEKWNHIIIPAKELRKTYKVRGVDGMCYDYYDGTVIFRPYGSYYYDNYDEVWLTTQKNKLAGSNIDFEYQFFQTSKGIQESIINIGKIRKYENIDYSKSYTKILSIDPAAGIEGKDRNAIGLWLMDEEINLYLYKLYFNHYQYPELLKFLSSLYEEEMIDIMLIEHTSVGISLVQDFEKKKYGKSLNDKERRDKSENPRNPINAIKVPTNKEVRAAEANTFIEMGKLYLPDRLMNYSELKHEANQNVLDILLNELKNFPMTKFDDGVDQTTQCINYVKSRFCVKKQKSFKNKIYIL